MIAMKAFLISASFIFLLTPQAFSNETSEGPGEEYKKSFNARKKKCEDKGGKFGDYGLLGYNVCNLPTKDAGKPCTSSRQCQGACINKKLMGKGRRASGNCYEWRIARKECFSQIEGGRSQGRTCND
jgi:hypothetical protein